MCVRSWTAYRDSRIYKMRRHWHHSGSAFEYFEWKRRGIVGRIVDYCFPSAIAVVWVLAFMVTCAAIALATLAMELPGGW